MKGNNLQVEGLVLVELDEQQRAAVGAAHVRALREQAARVQRADEVRQRLALHADVRAEDVVAHLQPSHSTTSNYLTSYMLHHSACKIPLLATSLFLLIAEGLELNPNWFTR